VRDVHELRTRKMGDFALVDAHILVDPLISVSEGHYIAESARARVLTDSRVLDALIHVDPENDALARPPIGLPNSRAGCRGGGCGAWRTWRAGGGRQHSLPEHRPRCRRDVACHRDPARLESDAQRLAHLDLAEELKSGAWACGKTERIEGLLLWTSRLRSRNDSDCDQDIAIAATGSAGRRRSSEPACAGASPPRATSSKRQLRVEFDFAQHDACAHLRDRRNLEDAFVQEASYALMSGATILRM
jgi:hypothetical protein